MFPTYRIKIGKKPNINAATIKSPISSFEMSNTVSAAVLSAKFIIAKKTIGGMKNISNDSILKKISFKSPSRSLKCVTLSPSELKAVPKNMVINSICKIFPSATGLTKSSGIISTMNLIGEICFVSAEISAAGNPLICGTSPPKKIHATAYEKHTEIVIRLNEQQINFKPILPVPVLVLMPVMPLTMLKKITGVISKFSAFRNIV